MLHTVFPPGGQAGTAVTVAVQGASLDGLTALRFADSNNSATKLTAEKTGDNQFLITIPADAPPGLYDLRLVGSRGVSAPRPFFVSRLIEQIEAEPNNDPTTATSVSLDSVVNGKIETPGDVDVCRFPASAGQRIVIECWAERIDSQLHGVLELYDATGKKLASNRGETGIDPLVDLVIPADGEYVVKLFDLTFAGSANHFYRLDIDTKPRVEFAFPPVVERGKPTMVTLFGRNLPRENSANAAAATSDDAKVVNAIDGPVSTIVSEQSRPRANDRPEIARIAVEISIPSASDQVVTTPRAANHLAPRQLASELTTYHFPGGHAPIWIGVSDVPVVLEQSQNHSPASAQTVELPCEIAGRLTQGVEQDWYAVDVERGDVLWIEAFGERIGSPVDLDLVVLDASGMQELAHLTDCLDHQGNAGFPTNHLDPSGRWVAPADGRYLLMIRNLIGGSRDDARRVYRISVRREEPTFHLAAQSRLPEQMTALNLQRGGREMLDLLIERRRGDDRAIRITAANLPIGVECPPIWIGPGTERAPLIISYAREALPFVGELQLTGETADGTKQVVRGIMYAAPGMTMPNRRVTDDIAFATTAGDFPLSLTATMEPVGFSGKLDTKNGDPIVYQGSVIDLLITAEYRLSETSPISLSGVGLPKAIENQYATIPAGQKQAWLSFQLPTSLPPGPYTIAIQGVTEIPTAAVTPGSQGKTAVTCFTNPISFYVAEAKIEVVIDPFAPQKIARGSIVQLNYTARRRHGFIGKIHTDLVAPGGVIGVRGRGVTFTSGTETGTIQIIATENAPLGKQPFLRLDAVGTVEDRQVYRGGRFLELEITE
ncbi:MAG: PPC domain-containing protein [Planctomycetaceae bacterium]